MDARLLWVSIILFAVTHVVGARPNFVKAAPVMHALNAVDVKQRLVHTGQHYSNALSQSFIDVLGMPQPDINLGVSSASSLSTSIANLLNALDNELAINCPDALIVYGDVNSTVAAAMVGASYDIPIVHVEAGLRSFDKMMPEERNRKVTDALTDLYLVTCVDAIKHLLDEGILRQKIKFVGNTMIDSLKKVQPIRIFGFEYVMLTAHRPSNVDNKQRLTQLYNLCTKLGNVIFPLHPRTTANLKRFGLYEKFSKLSNVQLLGPMQYDEFINAMRYASAVITDSGGVQEETSALNIPCFTIRKNTERPVTVAFGTNRLVEINEIQRWMKYKKQAAYIPLWDGAAGPRAADAIFTFLEEINDAKLA